MPMYSDAAIFLVEHEILPLVIFTAILIAVRLGWYAGNRLHHRSEGVRTTTDDTLIGAILGLMGLLIAFSFSGATTRFEQRTHQIVAEANAVAAAYNSVSFLPDKTQAELRGDFRDYLTQRLALYSDMPDFALYETKRQVIETTLHAIDTVTRKAYQQAQGDVKAQIEETIRKVADMNAAYITQRQGMLFHQPRIIWVSLFLMVFIGSFLAGYKMGLSQRRETFLTTMFALLMACAIYLIIVIEFPLLGKISLNQYNQEFVNIMRRIP